MTNKARRQLPGFRAIALKPKDLPTPTNGALLAMLRSARVSYPRWLGFALPGALLVMLVGVAGMALVIAGF